MNSLLPAVARAMHSRNITVRFSPVDYLPIEERRRIIEKMLVHVYRLAHNFGFSLGGVPTIVSNSDKTFPPAEVLENLSNLHLDVLGTYHVLGTADVAKDAVEALIDEVTSNGRHPANYPALITDAGDVNLKGLDAQD